MPDRIATLTLSRAHGVFGVPAPRHASPRAPDRPDLSGWASPAEKLIVAIRLEAGNVHTRGHVELLQHFPGLWIDLSQIAFLAFPCGVPKLSIDPSDPGDEAVGLDCAKNRPGVGVDLMDLPAPILPNPQ